MKWSIKSFLAKIASRNNLPAEDYGLINEPITDGDQVAPNSAQLDNSNSSSCTRDTSTYKSASDDGVADMPLDSDASESSASSYLDITLEILEGEEGEDDGKEIKPRERQLRFSVDLNENFTEDHNQIVQNAMLMLPKRHKMTIKSILKAPRKGRRDTARRKKPMVVLDKGSWQEVGYSWKENPTLGEQKFMYFMLEMINDQWDSVTVPLYDLNSYVIVSQPPSVVDLTVYDDDADEFGMFFNQRYIVTNYLMEGSPCGLCQPDISTGIRVVRKPVLQYVKTAKVLDSYALPPVAWVSPEEFNGEFLKDEQEEQRYKSRQIEMVDRSNKKDFSVNPQLEEFKNGTWRLTIFEESEEAVSMNARRAMTSSDIQKMFGLSDAGSIILNVDHIDVVQGKCGYNRGKATRRFMVPLGEEAMRKDRLRDIRRRWSGLFSSPTFDVANDFGEDWDCDSWII